MCRNRSYDCQWLAERASNPRVRDILLDMARTWTRLALEAEEWRRDNSPKSRLAKKDATKDRFRSLVRNPSRPLDQQLDGSPISTKTNGGIMKKAKKRAKSKSSSKRRVRSKKSSKRVAAKSKTRKRTKTKRPTKSKKSSLPNTSKLKRVAKEAAVAAGVAALGTALSAMEPQRKGAEKDDTSKN